MRISECGVRSARRIQGQLRHASLFRTLHSPLQIENGCRGWNRTSIRAFKGRCPTVRRPGNKWWPARVTRPVLRIKSPLHHFNACRPKIGARGRIRTCTADALDVVPLLVGLHERFLEPPPGIAPDYLPYQRSASLKMLWGRENWCPQPDSHRQPDA